MSYKTPILFIIFNRPDVTERVFDEIKRIKPSMLFIAADGPRKNIINENYKCDAARKVVEDVNWNCNVKRLYQPFNLGCKIGVITALDWFFNHVEEGVILEDDCLPEEGFFYFCESLLNEYRNNDEITSISGSNWGFNKNTNQSSYFYSQFMNMWGWATWKRFYKKVDFEMLQWKNSQNKQVFIQKLLNSNDKYWIKYWLDTFEKTAAGEIDTWDYQWNFNNLYYQGHVIIPSKNMITNLGFSKSATHTKELKDPLKFLKTYNIKLPLNHPKDRNYNKKYEEYIKYSWCRYKPLNFYQRLFLKFTGRV